MTDAAEGGGLGKSEKTRQDDQENNDATYQTNLDCLDVGPSPSPRLIEKIDPKDLDQIVKILYSSHRKASTQSLILKSFEIISRTNCFFRGHLWKNEAREKRVRLPGDLAHRAPPLSVKSGNLHASIS